MLNFRFYYWCILGCSSLGRLKWGIIKFVFLEYWYEGGSSGIAGNQTLVKVMFQCREPTMAMLIPPPSTVLWPHPVACIGLSRERTRDPPCSCTQPGIMRPRAPWIICQLAPIVPDGVNAMFYIFLIPFNFWCSPLLASLFGLIKIAKRSLLPFLI